MAKEKTQVFDFDQRDDWRFREYIRKFHEKGRMKKNNSRRDHLLFLPTSVKKSADRAKILDLVKLINVTEPNTETSEEEEPKDAEIAKKLEGIKKSLLAWICQRIIRIFY